MSVRKVLDCTLRDGGYCNDWNFGSDNIKKITAGLCEANVDIIECGFLTNTVTYRPDCSRFTTVEQMIPMIPENRRGKLFVVLGFQEILLYKHEIMLPFLLLLLYLIRCIQKFL